MRMLYLSRLYLLLAVMALLYSMPAFAEEATPSAGELERVSLGALEISASKDTTQRITQDEIQRTGASNLWEALDLAPGVNQELIGARNDARISIRGFRQNQIRLMLDGVPVYVPYDGNEDIGRFLIDDLDTIEVSKGYSSVLTGSNAMGGVVNMISARPKKKFEAKARYVNYLDNRGNDMARQATLSMGTKQELFFLKATGSFVEQDFFRISDSFGGSPYYTLYNPSHQNQPRGKREFSGYRDKKLNLQAGLTPTEDSEVVFRYIAQRGEKEQPPYDGKERATKNNPVRRNWDWPEWDKDSFILSSKFSPFTDFTVKANAYYDRYENQLDDYRYDWEQSVVDNKSRYEDYAYGGGLELDYRVNDMHKLAGSITYRRDAHKRRDTQLEARSGSPYEPWHTTKRIKEDIWTGALEYTLTPVENLSFVFGTSYVKSKPRQVWDSDDKGEALDKGNGEHFWDGQAGVFWDVKPNHQIYATIAKKSRLPTMSDRFKVSTDGNNWSDVSRLPNPDLKPEKAMHYEMGWRGTIHNKIKVGASIFHSEVKDLIENAVILKPDGSGDTYDQYNNVNKTAFTGVEVSLDVSVNEWLSLGATYSYLEWKIRDTGDVQMERLTSLPKYKANGYMVIMPVEGLSLVPRFEYRAESYYETSVSSPGTGKTDEFALAHFKAMYDVNEYFSIEAGVNNIFDTHYEYEEGYSMPGRVFFVGATFTF